MKPLSPPAIAFVLTGGDSRGASQVGMLRALLEVGILPDMIVGTSIGALNGLWLASHPDLSAMTSLEQLWEQASLIRIVGSNIFELLANVATKRSALTSHAGVNHLLTSPVAEGLFSLSFEDLNIPLKVTATNLTRGTLDVLDHGPVAPAVLASSSIPGLFPPVEIDGYQYVDGGVLDNGGVRVGVETGAHTIYILAASLDDPSRCP